MYKYYEPDYLGLISVRLKYRFNYIKNRGKNICFPKEWQN